MVGLCSCLCVFVSLWLIRCRKENAVFNLKQPAAGIVATAIVIGAALVFISLFDFPTFTGWVSYFLLCVIPMQIIVVVTWGCRHPDFAGKRSQPAKGLLLVLITLAAGV